MKAPCRLAVRNPFMRIVTALLAAVILLTAPASAENVQVITRDLEPFSFERDGRRTGYAMELWDAVSREINVTYATSVTDSAKNMIAAVQAKKADVAVGAISITAEREKIIDFSQPFYEGGQQILVSQKPAGLFDTIGAAVGNILNWQFLGSLALLFAAMLVVSHFVWLYEHKINDSMWPKNYLEGMWESLWWTISTLLVGGADNKGPIGVGGRIVAIVWMLLSIVLIALLTATFTTTLTINSLKGDINGPSDLPGKEVATIGGSISETWLKNKNAKVVPFADINACIEALKKGEVKAVVFDAPILKYALKKFGDSDLALVGAPFDRHNYGFALQEGSKFREPINRALLSLSEQGVIDELRAKWFGEDE